MNPMRQRIQQKTVSPEKTSMSEKSLPCHSEFRCEQSSGVGICSRKLRRRNGKIIRKLQNLTPPSTRLVSRCRSMKPFTNEHSRRAPHAPEDSLRLRRKRYDPGDSQACAGVRREGREAKADRAFKEEITGMERAWKLLHTATKP